MVGRYHELFERLSKEDWPQRQDSLRDQLADLSWLAGAIGLYDAQDFLRDQLGPYPQEPLGELDDAKREPCPCHRLVRGGCMKEAGCLEETAAWCRREQPQGPQGPKVREIKPPRRVWE